MMGSVNRSNNVTAALIMGRRIRALRREAGLSLRELGAAVGVSLVQFQRYETGVSPLSTSRLLVISKVLGVRPGSLLGELPLAVSDDQVSRRRQEDRELAELFATLVDPVDRRAILNLARAAAARDEMERLASPNSPSEFSAARTEAK